MGSAGPRRDGTALVGMAEAERQRRVARRLHAASGDRTAWEMVNLEGQRPWIDMACRPGHAEEQE